MNIILPKEQVIECGKKKFAARRRAFRKMFYEHKIDIKNYPKVSQGYRFGTADCEGEDDENFVDAEFAGTSK